LYLVCDHERRAFAVELLDERTYLNGRLADGDYFATARLANAVAAPAPGLRFTGLIKIREYVHGYEWSRFQWRPDRHRLIDRVLTAYVRAVLVGRFAAYQSRYGDVHERNVLFEVRPWRARGVPLLARDEAGRYRLVRVGLRPVDVR
jgi:hypothetical protein